MHIRINNVIGELQFIKHLASCNWRFQLDHHLLVHLFGTNLSKSIEGVNWLSKYSEELNYEFV